MSRHELSVASYNLLADQYITPDRYPHVNPRLLTKEERWPKLRDRLTGLQADVLCVQEASREFCAFADADLRQAGYIHSYHKYPTWKSTGCSIYVHRGRILVESECYTFQAGEAPGDSHIAQIITIAESSAPLFSIVNTHLAWDDPSQSDTQRLGLRQVHELLAHLKELRWRKNLPTIICGDFNATPDSEVLKHCFNAGFQNPFPPTTHTLGLAGPPRQVDYLLGSGDLVGMTLNGPSIDANDPPPNQYEPSDHLPLIARFLYAR